MRSGVNLHGRAEEREVADLHLANIEHDAVEFEEDALSEQEVRSVVTEKRRLHPNRIASAAEKLLQDRSPPLLIALARRIQILAQVASAIARLDKLCIERIIEF